METLIILFFLLTTLYYALAQDSQLLDKEWTLDHITLDNLNYYPPFENGEGSDSQIEFYDSEVSELVVVFCSFISVVYEFSSTSSEFTTIGSWGGSTNQCFNEDNQNYEGMYYNDFWLTHNDTSNNTFSYNIVTGDDGTMMLTITNENELIAVSRDDGKVLWVTGLPRFEDPKYKEDPIVWSGPILASDRLIVAGSNGEALAVSPYNGRLLGIVEMPDGVSVPPIVANGSVIFLADDADHLHMAFRTNFRLDKHDTFLTSAIMSVAFTFMTIMFVNIYATEPDLPFMLPLGFGTAALFAYYVLGLIAYNKTHIIMDDDSVRVSRKPLPNFLREDHQVSLHGAVAIRCEETEASIKHNYDTPRYRVWAEMADGRRKTIIIDVTEEYAYYIARRLDERLHDEVAMSDDTSRLVDQGDIIDEGQFDDQSVGDLLQSPQSSR